MRWKKTLQTVDVHCGGEIGRVITGGVIDIPGKTMVDKLNYINNVDDSLRKLVCSEPRGGPAGSVVLLLPPTIDEADAAIIILQPDKAHAMSGANTMCTTTALLETGVIEMTEPETVVKFDTASGIVVATAKCKNGKVTQVSLDMPAAFVLQQDVKFSSKQFGDITFDITYGSIFYAMVEVGQVGLKINPESARDLAKAGVDLIGEMENSGINPQHPEIEGINGLSYVMFYSKQADGSVKTCTTLKPGRIDRSPCGTGSTAFMAFLSEKGEKKVGETQKTCSTIGSEFTTELLGTGTMGNIKTADVRVSGQAWIYGISQMGLDPTDPFPEGFHVSDT